MAHPSYFYHIVTSKGSKVPTQVPPLLAVTLKLNLFHTWEVVQIVFPVHLLHVHPAVDAGVEHAANDMANLTV